MATPKLASAGWAFITGLAILANPRVIPGSKTVVIDTQLYIGPTDDNLIIGSLRYFNSANLTFHDGPHLYAIVATLAQSGPECVADLPVSQIEYTFIGDINSLISLGPPGPRYLVPDSPSEGHESDADLNVLPTFTIDPRVRPFIQISGVATEISKTDATFEVNVEQYVSCIKSGPSTSGSRFKPITHFFCHIPDSPKYKSWKSKPVPGNKRHVSVCGFLTGADRTSEVVRFLVDVEQVTFGGHYIQPVNAATSGSQTASEAPAQAVTLFSYGAPRQSPSKPRKQQDRDGRD